MNPFAAGEPPRAAIFVGWARDNPDPGGLPWRIVANTFFSVVALVAGVIFARVIYPVEITERGGRFKGCGPDFLASLATVTRGSR